MKKQRRAAIVSGLTTAACLAGSTPAARGGLFASFSYIHTLSGSNDYGFGSVGADTTLSGSTLPVQQTLSVSPADITASSTYSIADNGTTATYQINCQASITQQDCSVLEAATSPGDVFTMAVPATYVATFSDVGGGGINFQFRTPDLASIFSFTGNEPMTHTGTVTAGEQVTIFEYWELSTNTGPASRAAVSGSESLSIVFTAVPEPASTAGAAVAGAAVLARRRRR